MRRQDQPHTGRSNRAGEIERRVATVMAELRDLSDQLLAQINDRRSAEEALRRSQETVTALLNAPPDSALLIAPDGGILAANATAVKRLRRYAAPGKRHDLVGVNVYSLFPKDLAERRRQRNEAVLKSGKPARYEDERGGHWFDNSIYPVRGRGGRIDALAIFSRDITERKLAERAIERSQQTIRALLNAPTDAALLLDTEGKILAANETAARRLASHANIPFTGDPEALHGLNVYDLLPKQLAEPRRRRNAQVIATGEPARFEDERNGNWFDNSIYPVLGAGGSVVALAVFSRDITDLKRAEERFRHLAFHDSLTGLPNRAALQARLDVTLTEAARNGDEVTVMCLDLDGFKSLNDSRGHETGDRLLTIVGDRLSKVIRGHDTAARLGGDEFVLVFAGAGRAHARLLADRVVRALSAPYDLDGVTVQISTSVGVAVYPEDGLDSAALLRAADSAMYAAKSAGRGRYRLAPQSGRAAAPSPRSTRSASATLSPA